MVPSPSATSTPDGAISSTDGTGRPMTAASPSATTAIASPAATNAGRSRGPGLVARRSGWRRGRGADSEEACLEIVRERGVERRDRSPPSFLE